MIGPNALSFEAHQLKQVGTCQFLRSCPRILILPQKSAFTIGRCYLWCVCSFPLACDFTEDFAFNFFFHLLFCIHFAFHFLSRQYENLMKPICPLGNQYWILFCAIDTKGYFRWESEGYFKVDPEKDGKAFVISMPPPNVTGALHMGHAMFVTLEVCWTSLPLCNTSASW